MVVDKPARLLTTPNAENQAFTLTAILNTQLKEKGFPYRLHPCHRLDKDTSGIVIFAKGKSAQKKIMQLFKERKVKKKYIALVQGVLARSEGRINFPIDGHYALTEYKVLNRKKDYSVVLAVPITGRKNQLRLHFKHIGHPLVGEAKFAFRRDFSLKAKRPLLHAQAVEFLHPWTNRLLYVEAQLPEDIKDFLAQH